MTVINNKKKLVPALISEGVLFEGKASSVGVLQVEGILVGEIWETDSLVIGETGKIEGNAQAETIVVYGVVTGNLAATTITLKKSAVVSGELRARQLIIERGANYRGNLIMEQ